MTALCYSLLNGNERTELGILACLVFKSGLLKIFLLLVFDHIAYLSTSLLSLGEKKVGSSQNPVRFRQPDKCVFS